MEEDAKKKISECVLEYKRLAPEEYKQFLVQLADRKKNMKNDYGSAPGVELFQRILGEKPENLHLLIIQTLEVDQAAWFNSQDGSFWFFKTFPEFRLTRNI